MTMPFYIVKAITRCENTGCNIVLVLPDGDVSKTCYVFDCAAPIGLDVDVNKYAAALKIPWPFIAMPDFQAGMQELLETHKANCTKPRRSTMTLKTPPLYQPCKSTVYVQGKEIKCDLQDGTRHFYHMNKESSVYWNTFALCGKRIRQRDEVTFHNLPHHDACVFTEPAAVEAQCDYKVYNKQCILNLGHYGSHSYFPPMGSKMPSKYELRGTTAEKPQHYTDTKITPLDVIDDWDLDFRLGNAVKYIKRYRLKGTPIEDLEKAATYVNMKIEQLKSKETKK